MKTRFFCIFPFLSFLLICSSSVAQSINKPTFIIVHGAWGGGWAFKKVDSLLTAEGATVYRPTMTGQGERVHLASNDVGLKTHILDIVNTFLFEELDDVILVGHSYGGMVVTGVADTIPDRIKKLIYLDAFVPRNGESLTEIAGEIRLPVKDGGVVPSWVSKDQIPPMDVPHPLNTFKEKLYLDHAEQYKIPTTYILTVEKGVDPEKDDFASQAKRARANGWPIFNLEADHYPQWSSPLEFARLLMRIAQD